MDVCESAYCSGEDCFSDCSENSTNVDEESCEEKAETYDVEVAVIGNGPSAIFLSLLLSGHVPRFIGTLKNTALKLKLEEEKKSLLDYDLRYLSEGLEGRSNNPVALLFDALFHPEADVGEEQPSPLKWVEPTDGTKKCSHIVIGEQKPGGQWHIMEKSILTLSLSNWLELPVFSFNDWKKAKGKSIIDEKMPDFYPTREFACMRAAVGDVAEYYSQYVEHMDLTDNFKTGLTVEKVMVKRKVSTSQKVETMSQSESSCQNGSCKINKKVFPEDRGVVCSVIDDCQQWIIRSKRSKDSVSDKEPAEILVRAKNLVLAGGLGAPMKLGVPGEDLDYVVSLEMFRCKLGEIKQSGGKVLVVGAGISGCDLTLLCLREGIPCYHAFKQKPSDSSLMVTGMVPGVYQEYYYLSTLMKGIDTSHLYTPLAQHVVKEFKANGECLLVDMKNNSMTKINVIQVVVMIGYSTNLDYLPDDVKMHLLSDPTQPIHHKKNPLDVDLYSFRSEVFPNLYALGPLAGDNFVRFVFGSGLGCAKSILYNSPTKS